MASPPVDWNTLCQSFPRKLVEALRRHFDQGPFAIRAHQLAIEANTGDEIAEKLLKQISGVGALAVEDEVFCPCERRVQLKPEHASQDICTECDNAFKEDIGALPIQVEVYVHHAPRSRDVRWLLALHGINTRGAWQESFNWLVSRAYNHAVPVAIYKYGVIRPGAILKSRHRALVEELRGRINRLAGETAESGFGGAPDIIAHSFGTWLLGHALQEDGSLKVGRVVLTGCILRPDFDWASLIRRGQVEAVLCHTASKDLWASIAHFIIPDSGPAGVRGFNDRLHIGYATLQGGHHSDFFDEEMMPNLFRETWQPFLTEPPRSPVRTSNSLPAPDWEAVCWPLRATTLRILVLILFVVVVAASGTALALGAVDIWQIVTGNWR